MSKKGLDYFSHDVDYDGKLEIVISKFGEKGHGIITRIWQHIYKNEGFYMPYNEDELFMIQKKCADASLTEIEILIAEMLKKDLLCKHLYEKYNILTSKRLQENFIDVAERRKDVDINWNYVIAPLSLRSQSKVKKIKAKKSIVKKSKIEEVLPTEITDDLKFIVSLFEEELKRMITNNESITISDWIANDQYTKDEIKNALFIAIKRQNTSLPYIKGIMAKERDNDNYPNGFTKLEKPSLEETFGVIRK